MYCAMLVSVWNISVIMQAGGPTDVEIGGSVFIFSYQ